MEVSRSIVHLVEIKGCINKRKRKILSTEGLGTEENQEQDLWCQQHPAAHHLAGGASTSLQSYVTGANNIQQTTIKLGGANIFAVFVLCATEAEPAVVQVT